MTEEETSSRRGGYRAFVESAQRAKKPKETQTEDGMVNAMLRAKAAMDRLTVVQPSEQTSEQTDGRTDRRTDRRTDGQTLG